ncbi:MAG: hypothetical protein ACFFAQ_14425 [Promethearchaeota archaeon]
MEKIFNLNLKAQENLIIAKKEKLVALQLKKLAKSLLKKAKTREMFVEKEIKLALIRKNLVESNDKLLENKIKSKELLKFPEEVITNEKAFINYHEKVAENQLELAKHHKEIATLEEKLAKSKLRLVNSKIYAANIRIKLGKLQLKYVKVVQKNSPEKAMIIKTQYKQKQKDLDHHLKELIEKEMEVKIIQNDIANLKSKFS